MKRRFLLLAGPVVLAAPAARAQGGARRLPPRDESGRDPDLRKTVEAVRAACRAKSVDRLKPLLHDFVRGSPGGGGSPARFLDAFDATPALWQELDTCFALGGTFMRRDVFAAPYVHSAFPDDLAGRDWLVALGGDVTVHETPRDTGVVAARLAHDIVRRLEPEAARRTPPDWVRVKPPIGVPGFVRRSAVRSPRDYRAVLERRGAGWALAALVTGD
jgi:hypothetical protein